MSTQQRTIPDLFLTYIIRRADCRICQLSSITFPGLSFPLRIGGRKDLAIVLRGRRGLRFADKIRGRGLGQVPIEFRPVGLFESRTQPKVGQFDMASGVQKQVVRLDIPTNKDKTY